METPSILFHYTSIAGFLGIVSGRKLWASSIRHMNDVTEYKYAHDVFVEVLKSEAEEVRKIDPVVTVTARSLADEISDSAREYSHVMSAHLGTNFVVSLSQREDRLSQWRAYCPKGGCHIGFEMSYLQELAKAHHLDLLQCEYDQAKQMEAARVVARQAVLNLLNIGGGEITEALTNGGVLAYNQLLYPVRVTLVRALDDFAPRWKNPAFQEEQEWRLISQSAPRELHFRAGLSSLIPYIELELNISSTHVDDQCVFLAGVTCAPSPEPELTAATIMLLLRQKKIGRAEVAQSKAPYRQW
jgi:hypothetical protein